MEVSDFLGADLQRACSDLLLRIEGLRRGTTDRFLRQGGNVLRNLRPGWPRW